MILYGDIKESVNPIGICLLTTMMTFNLIDCLKFNRDDRRYGEYKAIAKKYYGIYKPKINILNSHVVRYSTKSMDYNKLEKLISKSGEDPEKYRWNMCSVYEKENFKDDKEYIKRGKSLANILVATPKGLFQNGSYSKVKKNSKIIVDLKGAKKSGISDDTCNILLALIAGYELPGLDDLINSMKIELNKRDIIVKYDSNDGNVGKFGRMHIKAYESEDTNEMLYNSILYNIINS